MFRAAIAMLWCVFLFVCTCTQNFKLMVIYRYIHFRFNPHPDWHQILIVPSEDIIYSHTNWYLLQKAGHFLGFAILSAMLYKPGRSYGIVLAIGYAIVTEVLQLYFSRDGRIVDVCIDTAGILLAYLLLRAYGSKRSVPLPPPR
ncbi:hypothetical protein GXP70_08185 [Paenibacillus lycopersici]|uniref:VanZ-like domain-containing protein n=1 Tax=Paenibacillus lycopersici TaxID=2704462 RepID=A0A6C0FWU0_9BACL|nr:VanZ family protein [Paenibacillus lycopersici]QHT59933.1 hypothetical protein GXP70_08185 [Paenibacillus lycopersici]